MNNFDIQYICILSLYVNSLLFICIVVSTMHLFKFNVFAVQNFSKIKQSIIGTQNRQLSEQNGTFNINCIFRYNFQQLCKWKHHATKKNTSHLLSVNYRQPQYSVVVVKYSTHWMISLFTNKRWDILKVDSTEQTISYD